MRSASLLATRGCDQPLPPMLLTSPASRDTFTPSPVSQMMADVHQHAHFLPGMPVRHFRDVLLVPGVSTASKSHNCPPRMVQDLAEAKAKGQGT